jgi:4-alpha-glucanotransferase
MDDTRRSGVLLHPTSLPGQFGIGSMNQAAYDWVDFLASTRQSIWQVLPLGPTGFGDSPYQSFSSFAGNPYLISLEDLVDEGLLDPDLLTNAPEFSAHRVDYGAIYQWKLPVLRQVAEAFANNGDANLQAEFDAFCTDHADWLDDFSLFMALKDANQGAPWSQWEMNLRSRKPSALTQATLEHAPAVHFHKVNQWLFFRQWSKLKAHANAKGIRILGDIPIFVAMDSSDTWTNPKEFFLNNEFQPTVVAGVPPDYFSTTGQLWGNPLYRWQSMKINDYAWWRRRINASLRLYDMIRIDHFRGFAGYWEIPAGESTAVNGQWVQGPGADFFAVVQRELGNLPIIAEDLGEITPDVIELRNQFNLPGMKVLQFAFASDASDKFLPHNYQPNFVVYSGTHDNDTTRGWYEGSATEHERNYFRRYLRTDGSEAAWSMIDAAWRSVATIAIAPLQDLLDLGNDARMNLPGSAQGNWSWRFSSHQITPELVDRLLEATTIYGRDPALYEGKGDEAGGQPAGDVKGAGGLAPVVS